MDMHYCEAQSNGNALCIMAGQRQRAAALDCAAQRQSEPEFYDAMRRNGYPLVAKCCKGMESGSLICPATADQGRSLHSSGEAAHGFYRQRNGEAERASDQQWQREASSATNSNAGHRAATAVNRTAETGAAEALIGSPLTAKQGHGIEVRGMNS